MKKQPIHDQDTLKKLKQTRDSLKRLEAFPYSESLRSVMVSPVYTCQPEECLSNVVAEMSKRGISSVVITDKKGFPRGILTERDLLNWLSGIKDIVDLRKIRISSLMTPDPITLGPDDTIYHALSVLNQKGIKHLPVVENKAVIGIVTLRQLLKLRHPEPMMLISEVYEAKSVEELRTVKEKLSFLAADKLSIGISAYDIVTMLSLINHDIHRRCIQLIKEELGPPPMEFCLFVSGSHGRMESLLSPDQDHGMIIEDREDYYEHEEYFIRFSRRLSEALITIGYPFCPGYIMSMNPTWRKTLKEWKLQIEYWFETQTPALSRYVTILFDAYPVYGPERLFTSLKEYSFKLLEGHHEVLRVLHEEEGSHRVPIGFLGKFITEKEGSHKGELDIKRSGLIFVVEAIRILALMKGVRETSTLKRLTKLIEKGVIHWDDGEYFESAYQILLHYALKAQVEKALEGKEIDTYLKPSRLSSYDRDVIRHAFKAVSALQDLVATEFGELVI